MQTRYLNVVSIKQHPPKKRYKSVSENLKNIYKQ